MIYTIKNKIPAIANLERRENKDNTPQLMMPIRANVMKILFFLLKSAYVPKMGQRITAIIVTITLVKLHTVERFSDGERYLKYKDKRAVASIT